MAAALEETSVTYEDLADIERDFEEVEVEISTFWPFSITPPRFAFSKAGEEPS